MNVFKNQMPTSHAYFRVKMKLIQIICLLLFYLFHSCLKVVSFASLLEYPERTKNKDDAVIQIQ